MQLLLSTLSFFVFVGDQEEVVARCATRNIDDDYEEEGIIVTVVLLLFAFRLELYYGYLYEV